MVKDYPYTLYKEFSGLHAPILHATEIEYMEILYALCHEYRVNSILEIGTANGHSTWWFERYARNHLHPYVKVVSVDSSLGLLPIEPRLRDSSFVEYIKQDSVDYLKTCNRKFDFVYIDGDHNYPKCLEDMYAVLDLNSAKVIAVHDTNYYDETVGRMVRELKNIGQWTHFPFGKGLSYVRLDR